MGAFHVLDRGSSPRGGSHFFFLWGFLPPWHHHLGVIFTHVIVIALKKNIPFFAHCHANMVCKFSLFENYQLMQSKND